VAGLLAGAACVVGAEALIFSIIFSSSENTETRQALRAYFEHYTMGPPVFLFPECKKLALLSFAFIISLPSVAKLLTSSVAMDGLERHGRGHLLTDL
jgi:hypothetical protein